MHSSSKCILVIISFLNVKIHALNEKCVGRRIKCIGGMVVGRKE